VAIAPAVAAPEVAVVLSTAVVEEAVVAATTEAEATQTATPPATHGGYDACHRIDKIHRAKKTNEVSDCNGFPAYFARLRDLLLPEKLKPLGITKYDAKQDKVQCLRCYALSIENVGGNNNTKCLYFCHMDLSGPTTLVGTRTDYSVGPWAYSACATQHLMAWGARTAVEEYLNRKLYMSCTV
jgi:nitrate reductase cytochrome c-type subunit